MEQTRRIVIIGAGGVGFWIATALSRAGVQYTIFDDDTLEGGLGFSRMPKASPSTKKVNLLRGHVIVSMGDRPPTIVDRRFVGDDARDGDLIVDASDMPLDVRKTLWAGTKAHGKDIRMLRVSYDGQNNTVVVAEGLPLRGKQGGGYANTPGLDLSYVAGGIGCMAVRAILAGTAPEYIEFQISISELIAGFAFTTPSLTIVEERIVKKVAEAVQPRPRRRRK